MLVAGYPLWWMLGVTQAVVPVVGAMLAWKLRGRKLALPPGFGLWLLFLLVVLLSGACLNLVLPGTLPPVGVGRYVFFVVRLLTYIGATVVLVYVANASEAELSRERIVRWMAWLGVTTIVLGTLAIAIPHLSVRSVSAHFLPNNALGADATVRLAQVQPVLGDLTPRPSAPFDYTNMWGTIVSLLAIWMVVWWGVMARRRRQQLAVWLVLALAVVPMVYSLNRGVWIGLGLTVVVVAVRLAICGRATTLVALVVLLVLGGAVFALSPLNNLVQQRASHGHSNNIRGSLATATVDAAVSSPLVGYGSTRLQAGSDASIAIGRSANCPLCGNRILGSTGQIWLLLISQGFLGLALYTLFFLRVMWAYRRDHSPIGIAATLTVGLLLFYGLFYNALDMPLVVGMLAIGLLMRNAQLRGRPIREAREPVGQRRGGRSE